MGSRHPLLPAGLRQSMDVRIQRSVHHLREGDPRFFEAQLPSDQLWRLFPEFRDDVAYLDIETTGLSPWGAHITTVALFDGQAVRHYVHGQNLERFKEDVEKYKVLVTYNGRCFDLPFIRRDLGIPMRHVHLDLRYILRSLGYKGGLKGCERQLGIQRGELEGVDGYFAVLLWEEYARRGNTRALETLLAYNIQDVVSLETLMVISYNLKLEATPFGESRCLPLPAPPEVPFTPDRETIDRIRLELGARAG